MNNPTIQQRSHILPSATLVQDERTREINAGDPAAFSVPTIALPERVDTATHKRDLCDHGLGGLAVTSSRRRVLIVDAGAYGRKIAARLQWDVRSGRKVIGFIDDVKAGPDILGSLVDLTTIARRNFVDEIVFA